MTKILTKRNWRLAGLAAPLGGAAGFLVGAMLVGEYSNYGFYHGEWIGSAFVGALLAVVVVFFIAAIRDRD